VTEIETNEAATAVTGLKLRTLGGKAFRAHAKYFILATGGIENARLLLLSSARMATGLGNQHDLVGRFFMEHLTFPDFAKFYPSDPQLKLDFYKPAAFNRAWGETWGILTFSEDSFQKERVSNIRFQVATVINRFNADMQREGMQSLQTLRQSLGKGLPNEFERHLANVIADIDLVANSAYVFLRHRPNYPLVYVHIVTIQEQVPNPHSRIFLGDEIDRLGQRRVVVDWRITDLDWAMVRRGAEVLGKALGIAGLGRLQDNLDRKELSAAFPKPHYHHMGTTRMHDDPKQGVVDANCRVHSLANLYVAGSSVFPTVGNVNPTFTLVALAIRLADHLKKQSSA
jgi:choline dehydrogenase-like flavoprotein